MREPNGGRTSRCYSRESPGDEPDEPHPQSAIAAGVVTGPRTGRD